MMHFKHELKELVEKGQQLLHKMEGSMGQRGGYYGMRGGDGGYSGGSGGYNSGGSYGQREPWMQGGNPPQQEHWQNIDPRWFM